jgi:hypothetical protein
VPSGSKIGQCGEGKREILIADERATHNGRGEPPRGDARLLLADDAEENEDGKKNL